MSHEFLSGKCFRSVTSPTKFFLKTPQNVLLWHQTSLTIDLSLSCKHVYYLKKLKFFLICDMTTLSLVTVHCCHGDYSRRQQHHFCYIIFSCVIGNHGKNNMYDQLVTCESTERWCRGVGHITGCHVTEFPYWLKFRGSNSRCTESVQVK